MPLPHLLASWPKASSSPGPPSRDPCLLLNSLRFRGLGFSLNVGFLGFGFWGLESRGLDFVGYATPTQALNPKP